MYDTSAKSDWDTLQNQKVEGTPMRDRLEALKKKIEKPVRKEEEEKRASPKIIPDKAIEEKVREEDSLSNFEETKAPKKPFRLMKDSIKEIAKNNFQNEEAKVTVRPEFDNLRLKIRDEVSDKITLSSKLLQKTGEDQILNTFMKNHAKIKKVKADYQRPENPKDLDFGPEDRRDAKRDFDMEDEEFVDFRKINQDKVDRIVKEQLNRKFPNEIDNIQKLEEKKYVLLTNTKGQDYGKNDLYGINPQLDKKASHHEDIIESYSVVVDKSSKLQPIPFYRELGPFAREVVNIKNESKLKNNKLALDLMDEKEFAIDDGNITFENIINIVTGRISGKRLKKILNRLDYTEFSDDGRDEGEDADDYVPSQGKRNFEELNRQLEKEKSLKAARTKEIEYINALNHQNQLQGKERYDPDGLFENLEHSDHEYKPQALEQVEFLDNYQQHEDFDRIENQADHQNQYPQQQKVGIIHPIMASRSSVAVEDYGQQFPTPKEEEDIKMETGETLRNKVINQLSSESENTNRTNSPNNVNTLLREIESLKEAKNNANKLPKLRSLLEFRQQLNSKIEDKLAQLFYLIADEADRKRSLKENLADLIKDIHLLEGKVLDGHLKKNLLFQFLIEYKKLVDETEELRKEGLSEMETLSMLNEEGRTRAIRPGETERTNSEAFQTHTERIFTSSGQEKKRSNDKLSAQNTLKSQKLPQPVEVRSHYMKQTQSSLRRLQDGKGNNVKQKPKSAFQERQNDVWIGGNNEEISDDDEWVQIDPYR